MSQISLVKRKMKLSKQLKRHASWKTPKTKGMTLFMTPMYQCFDNDTCTYVGFEFSELLKMLRKECWTLKLLKPMKRVVN